MISDTQRPNIETKTQSILEFIQDYEDYDDSNVDGGINDEINAATNLNSELFPKYYRRAMGFTVYGESCYDACELRDGYKYTWCHKFKSSQIGNSIVVWSLSTLQSTCYFMNFRDMVWCWFL